jgi:hypothetical protein
MNNLLNKLVRVTSYRGNPRNRVCRVVAVRDTIKLRPFKRVVPGGRSRWLVTVHDLRENVYRSYYHSFLTIREVGWFRRLLYRLSQWWEDN